MQILRDRKELDHLLARIRKKNLQIGLIPTMGGIHEGHLSLVKKSTQNKQVYHYQQIILIPHSSMTVKTTLIIQGKKKRILRNLVLLIVTAL